jgi:hypothetical protein
MDGLPTVGLPGSQLGRYLGSGAGAHTCISPLLPVSSVAEMN